MILFPNEDLTYGTKLSKHDVLRLIYDHLYAPGLRNSKNGKPKLFEGELDGYSFEISRRVYLRSRTWVPVVAGRIEDSADGAVIKATLRPTPYAMAFSVLWFSSVGSVCIASLLWLAISSRSLPFPAILPFAMLLFGGVFEVGSFNYDAWRTKECFRKLFVAEDRSE